MPPDIGLTIPRSLWNGVCCTEIVCCTEMVCVARKWCVALKCWLLFSLWLQYISFADSNYWHEERPRPISDIRHKSWAGCWQSQCAQSTCSPLAVYTADLCSKGVKYLWKSAFSVALFRPRQTKPACHAVSCISVQSHSSYEYPWRHHCAPPMNTPWWNRAVSNPQPTANHPLAEPLCPASSTGFAFVVYWRSRATLACNAPISPLPGSKTSNFVAYNYLGQSVSQSVS
jgi:hypothetical protein